MLKKLILVVLFTFTLGNLASVSKLGGYNLYIYDIFLLLFNAGSLLIYSRKNFFKFNLNSLLLGTFLIYGFITTLFAIYSYNFNDQILVLSYFLRFGNYTFFGFLIYSFLKSKILTSSDFEWILRTNFYLVLTLNLAQYFIFRDISSLAIYGFDPHQTRLTGTFLDPNFMGIYLVIYFLFSEKVLDSKIISFSSFAMILLTESRSAFLSLILVLFILLLKKPKYIFYIILLVTFSFGTSFVNRIELSKASNDSSNLRIESWKNAMQLYSFSPEFGVGFNNYRNMTKYFNLSVPEMHYANSSNSSDSSLLSILVMSGGVGLVLFLGYLFSFASKTPENLIYLSVILFNSLFINSLFFPSISVLVILILNYNLAKRN